jgi:hypothetical protein
MSKTTRWLVFLVALLAIAAAVILWWQKQAPPVALPEQPKAEPQAEAPPASAPVAPAGPEILHPIEIARGELGEESGAGSESEPAKPPALDESDPAATEALTGLYGREAFERFFFPNDLVRHIVATIDNLPRREVAQRLIPVRPPAGQFLTTGKEGSVVLSPQNYARYTPYVRLAQSVNTKTVVAAYVRLYPLFQQAYQELGYPNAYFNDRLIEVVDHLLEAPGADGPVMLVQPRVLYQFSDPQMEALSAGEKLLIRMGPENARKVKETLREVRRMLTGKKPE